MIAPSLPGTVCSIELGTDGKLRMPYASHDILSAYGVVSGGNGISLTDDLSPLFAAIHPDDRESVREAFIASAQHLTPYHFEFRLIHPERGEVWAEGRGQPEASG